MPSGGSADLLPPSTGTGSSPARGRPSKLAPAPIVPPLQSRESEVSSQHSHSSGSSHSSHSSVQARKRQEIFGSDELPSVVKPAWALLAILGLIAVCHAAGLYLFTRGFLLTRSETQGVAQCSGTGADADTYSLPPPRDASAEALLEWDAKLEAQNDCSLQPAFGRSVLLIVDALRFDFIAPVTDTADESWGPNPYYHGHFPLPSQLHAAQPANSFLAHFLSDAPTTTLQRLKGLTTGSLPTFVDAGSNFGAEAISEDNWIQQLRNSTARTSTQSRLAFMGDDTWLKLYPHLFDAEWTWSFDSFNVEDLHTVDRGVKAHLMPFLRAGTDDPLADWTLLVAHTLGLDHVGHRHTPSHAAMTAKLNEMNEFLGEVVASLPDDALLILAGDHGMDAQGDHGGEGELEVGSGVWLYSKQGFGGHKPAVGRPQAEFLKDVTALHESSRDEMESLFGPSSHRTFSPLGDTAAHRSVPQTDLVPTLSLALGAAVPFGNLGTIIPELFPPGDHDASRLLRAMRINARQLRRYLKEYGQSSSDLASFEGELSTQWLTALKHDAAASSAKAGSDEYYEARRKATVEYQKYNRMVMNRARSVWARFSLLKIAAGISVLLTSVAVAFKLLALSRRQGTPEKPFTMAVLSRSCLRNASIGSLVGALASAIAVIAQRNGGFPTEGIQWQDWLCFGLTLGAQLGVLLVRAPRDNSESPTEADTVKDRYQQRASADRRTSRSGPRSSLLADQLPGLLPVAVQSAAFASNSFTVWEDSVVHGLLVTILLFRAWRGWSLSVQLLEQTPAETSATTTDQPSMASVRAISERAKLRIPFLLGVTALLVRLAHSVNVCREEQAPTCLSGNFHLRPLSTLLAPEGQASLLAWGAPLLVLAACYTSSYVLPNLLVRSLRQSRSDTGLVRFWADWLFRPSLMLGSGWWIVDWIGEGLTTAAGQRPHDNALSATSAPAAILWGKNLVARANFALIIIVGITIWFFAPLCLEVKEEAGPSPATASAPGAPPSPTVTPADAAAEQQRRVQLLGFSNVFGSSYLLFFSLLFSLCWAVSQPMGQLTLAAAFVSIIALADAGDAERDLHMLSGLLGDRNASTPSTPRPLPGRTPTTLETTTLYLFGYSLFFATGHQATFPSIQWRAAFVGTTAVAYPWSPLLVILNTFGPLVLLPVAALPLILSWNLAPVPRGPTSRPMSTMRSLLMSAISLGLAATISALVCAIFAAHFRRHLMLFKIWAPRYMLGAAALVGTDVALLIVTAAWCLVASKTATTLGSAFE
ncbi:unnamed protein product [Parajaminaea phylloscopi]